MRWNPHPRHKPGVVPANAGTHNPREEFGEDSWSGTATVPTRVNHAVWVPAFRRDDTEGLAAS
ncbi:hypothetical protein ACVIU7_003611 [Bradyrhizobium liaoningense]|nr:hypothetical protein GCM10007858_36560 [Bradyrhizobium liaoningense]